MGIKDTFRELGDYFNYKRRDSIVASKVIKKQLKQESDRMEYYKFKKALYTKLDEVLSDGEFSKVFIRPADGQFYLYDLITKDDEFNTFYDWRFTAGRELVVRLKVLELN